MDLVEVQIVQPQPLEALLHPVHDVHTRRATIVRAGPHRVVDLGGDEQVRTGKAEIAEGLAQHRLGLAVHVGIRRIEEIDAVIERSADHGIGLALLHGTTECARAKRQLGYESARPAELPVFHNFSLFV
jgi:hypothetical protein